MFAVRFFANRFFPGRYFPHVGSGVAYIYISARLYSPSVTVTLKASATDATLKSPGVAIEVN